MKVRPILLIVVGALMVVWATGCQNADHTTHNGMTMGIESLAS